jgi:hypothetical protein
LNHRITDAQLPMSFDILDVKSIDAFDNPPQYAHMQHTMVRRHPSSAATRGPHP